MNSSVVKLAIITLVILLTGCVGKNFVRATDDTVADGTLVRDQVLLDFVGPCCLSPLSNVCASPGSAGKHTPIEIETCGGKDIAFLRDSYTTKAEIIRELEEPTYRK